MKPRIRPLLVLGIIVAIPPVVTTAVFHVFNDEIDSTFGRLDDDFAHAPVLALGLLGLIITIAAVFVRQEPSRTTSEAFRFQAGHQLDRFTASERSDWFLAFLPGPLIGIASAAVVTTWRFATVSPGENGTVWGDCLRSPAPALVILLSCWVLVTLCLTWRSIVRTCSCTSKSMSVTVSITGLVFLLFGGAALFAFVLPILPPVPALLTLLPILLAAQAVQLLIRRSARIRAALFYDPSIPFGPTDPEHPGSTLPPYDLLDPGERLLMWMRSDRSPEPQMLVATDRRFVLASIIENGSSYVLVQAAAGKLLGGSSGYQGPDIVTSALFSDRPPMRILGGDPIASARFAGALSDLARNGKMLC